MHDRSDNPPVQNENYESDVQFAMQFCRRVLKPIGIWPLIHGYTSRAEKVGSFVMIAICSLALGFVLLPLGAYIIVEEKDILVRVKLLGPASFCLTSTVKYYYLGLRRHAFRYCIDHVKKGWRTVADERHRQIMIRNATMGKNLAMLCAVFLYSGGVSYHTIMPLCTRGVVDNVTVRRHTYPGYDMLFDTQASPFYELLFCAHFLYSLVAFNITIASCSLAAIFVTHTCAQVQIEMTRLEELADRKKGDNTTIDERLGVIVRGHVEAIRFSGYVEEVLREICLMEVVACTLIICLLEYYILTEWEASDGIAITTYFLLLMSFTFDIFIFCYIGELLVDQCSKMGTASYNVNWYYLPDNKALGLILIIAISNYPPKLTAGKIVDLSLNTFGSVLKTSVVYLNLLRTVTE